MNQTPTENTGHILLVEDEEMVRSVASQMLQKFGYTVDMCANGSEAVAHYQKEWHHIDLIILDVIMPDMDGEETYDAMQAVNPDLTVLVSSGYSLDGKTRRIIDKGAHGFIQKPYRKGELYVKVSEALIKKKDDNPT